MSDFLIKRLVFKENESIVKIVRQYPLAHIFSILATLILISGPFFFLFLLFSWGLIGIVIFLFILLLGIIYGIREFILWYFNAFIITNQRVIDIDQRGLFDRIVSEAPYSQIQDISYRIKGIFKTIFHYGNIQIQTAGTTVKLELQNIYQPEKIQELITHLMRQNQNIDRQFKPQNEQNSEKELPRNDFEFIKGKIESLSEEQLVELNEKVKGEMKKRMFRL